MRFDLHVHTRYSYDSSLSLEALVRAARQRGLDGLAVLDHDQIQGAFELQRIAPFRVIVGEEIGTADGGIGALFLSERIPPHMSAVMTVARIKEQNGLVMIPHPFARAVPGKIDPRKVLAIIDDVDVIEGYNARTPFASDDGRAREFAGRHGIPVSAGSDGHFRCEIGRAWSAIEDFASASEFLDALRRAAGHHCRKTSPLVAAATVASIPIRSLAALANRRLG